MKRTCLSIFVVICLTVFTVSEVQSAYPKKYYFHFIGKINNQVLIEMNLIKINDSVYGNYSLVSKEGTFTKFMENNGYNTVTLYGRVNAKGIFIIKENPWDGSSFYGKLVDDHTLKGTWESDYGRIKYPFEFIDKYPEGSLPLNVWFQQGSVPLVKKSKSPAATFKYCLLSPQELADPASDTLTKMIFAKFVGKPVRKMSPDMLLNAMKQIYFGNYITTNESIYKESMGASFDWESLKFMDVVLNRSHLLTFYIEQYAFTGGAHGIQTRDYTVVDLRTGRAVSLKDIFSGDYEAVLTDLLTKKVRKMHNIGPDKKLTETGFFVESIKPTNNFYLTINGIGFYYNQYEIAPHSSGAEDIFLPFADLKTMPLKGELIKGLPGYSLQP